MKYVILIILPILLVGCFLRLPSKGIEGSRDHVGKTYILKRNILVSERNDVFETDQMGNLQARNEDFKVVKKGEEIEIKGIVSAFGSAGRFYYYVCKTPTVKKKFDLEFSMRDCIGLSDYDHWALDPSNPNKTVEEELLPAPRS